MEQMSLRIPSDHKALLDPSQLLLPGHIPSLSPPSLCSMTHWTILGPRSGRWLDNIIIIIIINIKIIHHHHHHYY